jgi:dTDP-4-dehydrorhamnose 3,5-epimerase-like enzyme
LNIIETAILSVLIMEPKLFDHDRGCFFELYHAGRYAVSGIPSTSCSTTWRGRPGRPAWPAF